MYPPTRPDTKTAQIIEDALRVQSTVDRSAAARELSERGVNFRTVVRVLDASGRYRAPCDNARAAASGI